MNEVAEQYKVRRHNDIRHDILSKLADGQISSRQLLGAALTPADSPQVHEVAIDNKVNEFASAVLMCWAQGKNLDYVMHDLISEELEILIKEEMKNG